MYWNWSIEGPAVWLGLSMAVEEFVCWLLRLIHTSLGCTDLTLITLQLINMNWAHTDVHICTHSSELCETHTHIKETQLVATLMWRNTHIHTNLTLFQSMRDPLWFLLGGLPSSHEFRNLVCQLAVRTRQVSPQHKSVSQGPINKHSRRTQGQINSETMYLPCSGCKIFLNTYKLAWSLLMAVHSHAPPLQRRWSDTPWAANVFSKSHYVSRNTCLKLQLLSPGICLGVIAVRSFKSTRRKSSAFYRTSPHQSVNHLFIRSAGSISKLKVRFTSCGRKAIVQNLLPVCDSEWVTCMQK